jgi:TatD DNase family protein
VIDSHAHLDACAEPVEAVLERAAEAGVTCVVTIGTGLESCRRALELAERHEQVVAALGIDPHRAAEPDAERVAELRPLLGHRRVVAVGETGLDNHHRFASAAQQLRLFEEQLALADDLSLPVVVHSRDAADDTAGALAGFAGRVVLHCFSSPDLLEPAVDRGYYVSFAGNVTYPRAADLRAAAQAVPADRLLAETDSPYLAPQPVRGRPNEPANVMHTVRVLADARGVDADELADSLAANAAAAFGLHALGDVGAESRARA